MPPARPAGPARPAAEVFTLDDVGPAYQRWLARTGHAEATKGLYGRQVAAYVAWLQVQEVERPGEYAGVLTDRFVRDYAVRDYRRHQLVDQKRAIATTETAVSAIGSFYDWLGLGKPKVPRTTPPRSAPKALPLADRRRVLRVAERRGPRDFALTATLLLTAVRVSECAGLDVDDVWVGDRKGRLEVRNGKGGRPRTAPVPADARAALRPWIAARAERTEHRHLGPLWLSREGGRLSVRRIQSLVAHIGQDAGVELSPHTLRHTFARNFLDQGGDLAALQEILGHTSRAATKVYTRPHPDRVSELAETRPPGPVATL